MKMRISLFHIINVIAGNISNHGTDLVILEYSSSLAGLKQVIKNHSGNSLVPGRCGNDFKNIISKHILQIKFMSIFYKIALG